jgi:serine/threonine protein kinase
MSDQDAKPLDQPDADVTFGAVDATEASGEAAPTYAPGTLVTSKYRLERPLGAGGQAAVWEARNLALDARVALKLLHDGSADDAQVTRLLREARAVARLGHPAVVRVFDLARSAQGDLFIVMELLEGTTLADELLERHRLSATETVQLLLPIVDALGTAHAQGIVHRDVKPENIFITRAGAGIQPKLLDFGVAKLKREPENAWKTAAGTVLGTPAYLSPEQAEGATDIDLRSDVWSLSATLYECVTGSLPFDGDTDQELFGRIAGSDPASILEHAAGDAELWTIVQRGLAKVREDRWPSMQSFGEALARWLVRHGVTRDASGVSLEATWLRDDHRTEQPPRAAPRVPRRGDDTRPRAATAPSRRKWAIFATVTAALVFSTLALAMQARGRRAPESPPRLPPITIVPAPRAPEPVIVPLTSMATTAKAPAPSVSSTSPTARPTSAPTASAPLQGSTSKAARERSRPAPALAGDNGLDLLSPYR